MHESLTERVRGAIQRLKRDRRFSQTAVAERLNVVPSAVSRTVNDAGRPITLDFLEAVADEAPGVLVAELVAPPDSVLKQLNADEAALLRALRHWPLSVTRALCAFVAFFADEPSEAMQTRNLHERWRHLGQKDRDWLYGVSILLDEGSLPPDLRAGLVDRLEAERRADAVPRGGKQRKATT